MLSVLSAVGPTVVRVASLRPGLLAGTVVALSVGMIPIPMGAARADAPASVEIGVVPLFEGVSGFGRTVTTSSPDAQRYFDQGLAFYWGFHHEEAIRSFREAARLDPACAMAYWGAALAAGPNINNATMEEEASKAAWSDLQMALERAGGCMQVEQDLIRALAERYANPVPEDRADLDRAYADAMRELRRAHPEDADVAALFAESLMVLRPWDLWSKEGEPRPETPEIVRTLDAALALRTDHPGANHFLIHTLEASPDPGKALPAANRLRALVPGAGHLLHMPSHIDIRLGHYADAITANRKAIEADLEYLDRGGVSGFYTIYRAHNYHFLAYAAMFAGQRQLAMDSARELVETVPLETVYEFVDLLDAFVIVPVHVMVRFGLWEELLREPAPPTGLPVSRAFWHHGRTVAFAALGRVDAAAVELALLKSAYQEIPESSYIGNNPSRVVLEIGLPFAEGELEYRRGNHDRAFELLRLAVERDDALKYDEPWGWMEPVRHALGALLVEQGRLEEAEAVYRKDLEIHPGNGWALHGLAEVLRKTGRTEDARRTEERFGKAWASSDVAIRASCYCRSKT